MASVLRWARTALRRAPSAPLRFPDSGFQIIPESKLVEEEHLDEFSTGVYYPVNIGDVYASKYQILGKLGFGSTSTVWLARNLQIGKANPSHPGYRHVRTALEIFVLQHPRGDHHCLVQDPMWDSWKDLLRRNPTRRFTLSLLKGGLQQIFKGLDYLHNECKSVHTDIKTDNILQEIADQGILDAFTQDELQYPSPRKFVNGMPVYMSRQFRLPKDFGGVVLSDFGAAVTGDLKRNHDAQPNVYRSPEVMIKAPWSYPIDIWNVGVMIWDLFEGRHLFYGNDPDGKDYSTRAHLSKVIGMLGAPPTEFLERGIRSKEFFGENGQWIADIQIPEDASLEHSETYLEGDDKKEFLRFVRGMLQWRPEDRKTAKELLQDPWLNG